MIIKFFSIVQSLSFALRSYLSHIILFFIGGLLGLLVFFGFFLFAVKILANQASVDYFITYWPDFYTFMIPFIDNILSKPERSILIILLGIIIFSLYDFGLINIAVNIYDKQPVSFFNFFRFGKALRYAMANISYWITVPIGLILFVMPGLVWYSRYYFIGYFISDKEVGMEESFPRSNYLTWGVRSKVLMLGVVLNILFFLVAYLNIYFAIFFMLPIMALARAFAYKQLLKTSVIPMTLQERLNI